VESVKFLLSRFDDFVVQVAAEIKNFNAEAFGIDKSLVRRSDLFTQYALVAAKQLWKIAN